MPETDLNLITPSATNPTDVVSVVIKGVRGSVDAENDLHSTRASALRLMKQIVALDAPGMNLGLVVEALKNQGHSPEIRLDSSYIRQVGRGDVAVLPNGAVVGYKVTASQRKILAAPSASDQALVLPGISQELIVLESDELVGRIDAVAVLPDPINVLPVAEEKDSDYSFILKQSNPDIIK